MSDEIFGLMQKARTLGLEEFANDLEVVLRKHEGKIPSRISDLEMEGIPYCEDPNVLNNLPMAPSGQLEWDSYSGRLQIKTIGDPYQAHARRISREDTDLKDLHLNTKIENTFWRCGFATIADIEFLFNSGLLPYMKNLGPTSLRDVKVALENRQLPPTP